MIDVVMRRAGVVGLALVLSTVGSCGYDTGGDVVGVTTVAGALMPSQQMYDSAEMAGAIADDRLPLQVDLRREGVIPPIQNQRWNNCVGWALGYYLMTALELRHFRLRGSNGGGNVLDVGDPENWFSPDYIYSQRELDTDVIEERAPHLVGAPLCREVDGRLGCMRPELAIASLMQNGCCRWPFICATSEDAAFRSCGDDEHESLGATSSLAPWQFAEPNGYYFRPRCFVRFGTLEDPNIEGGTVRQLQSWLHEQGTPIAIVVRMREGWLTYRGENRVQAPVLFRDRNCGLTEERGVCLNAGGPDVGSQHMMTIIGYDRTFPDPDTYPFGSFLVANQWGKKWGHDGYMWIPVSELQKIWIGGYGLIKWVVGAGGIPSQPVACAPNEFGEYIQLFECDDVPRNLVKVDADCSSSCAYHFDDTANLLMFSGDIATAKKAVGAQPNNGQPADTADWYRFMVAQDGTTVRCRTTSGPLLRLKVTDTDLRSVGAFDPATGETVATLCQGEHFVKVEPDFGGAWPVGRTSGECYTLTVTLVDPLAPVDPGTCDVGTPIEDDPPLVSSTANPTIEGNGWRFYRLDLDGLSDDDRDRVLDGRFRPRIQLSGLAPGERVEVVTGGPLPQFKFIFNSSVFFFPLNGFRNIEVCEADHEGLDLILEPPSGEKIKWDPVVGVRNADSDAVDLSLTISVLPPVGQPNEMTALDPSLLSIDASELPSWWQPGNTVQPHRFRVFSADFNFGFFGNDVIELRHSCPAPRIALVDAGGNDLGAQVELVDVSTGDDAALSAPGTIRKRLIVPSGWDQDVWVEAYDASGVPLRHFRVRWYQLANLGVWPMSGDVPLAKREADDSPAHATPLTTEIKDAVGFEILNGQAPFPEQRYAWDLYDYYVVENTAATPRRAWVVLTKDTGENIHVYRWSLDDLSRDRLLDFVGPSDKHGRFAVKPAAAPLTPGERVLVLVFSGTQKRTDYTVRVDWAP